MYVCVFIFIYTYICIDVYIYEFWETREWHHSENAKNVLPHSPSLSPAIDHKELPVNSSDDYKLPQCMTSKFGRCLSKYECALESVFHVKESFIKRVMAAKRLRTDRCFRGYTLQLCADFNYLPARGCCDLVHLLKILK